jgi:hypothetical protein
VFPQDLQVPPAAAHAVLDKEVHTPFVPPAQQPSGHDARSQTHAPPLHSSPAPHANPLPQVHAPDDEHPSAPGPQGEHAAPAVPHADADRVVHVGPVQHPPGQDDELQFVHAPPLQIWFWHELHRPPPEPQAPVSLPGMHVAPLQHPSHEVESQTHDPPEQCCPTEHAGPPPQVHAPPDEQPLPAAPHDWHVPPSVPQSGPVGGDVQTLPVQHPPAHDVLSQTQALFTHRCPVAHAPPAPQRQPPEGEQLSDFALSHVVHWLPSVPHAPRAGLVQTLLVQQPLGQDVELQMHEPFEQICPVAHGALLPHLHAPPVHRSACVAEHAVHAPPPVPHVDGAADSHVAPLQHPFGHVALHPVHTLFTQFCDDPHGLHVDPPLPHAEEDVPARHVDPEQHPPGHEVPLHTHDPLTHA